MKVARSRRSNVIKMHLRNILEEFSNAARCSIQVYLHWLCRIAFEFLVGLFYKSKCRSGSLSNTLKITLKNNNNNNNNNKNSSHCRLTSNTQFRIENNTWVQVDTEFLLPGLEILFKHCSLFYIVI